MSYIKRIIEEDLLDKLSASGAVLIKGPKSCGKTATAKQYSKSILEMDRDRVSGVKRDPLKVRSLLRSIARNTATLVDNKTLEQDVKTSEPLQGGDWIVRNCCSN